MPDGTNVRVQLDSVFRPAGGREARWACTRATSLCPNNESSAFAFAFRVGLGSFGQLFIDGRLSSRQRRLFLVGL